MRFVEGQRDVARILGVGRDGAVRDHAILHFLHHPAIGGDAGELARPHLGAAGNTPSAHVSDGAVTFNGDGRLDRRRLDLVVLVDVRTIVDFKLLAALELHGVVGVGIDFLAVEGHAVALTATARDHAVVDREQVARPAGISEPLVFYDLRDGGTDMNARIAAVQGDADATVEVPDEACHEEERRAANDHERIRAPGVATTATLTTSADVRARTPVVASEAL